MTAVNPTDIWLCAGLTVMLDFVPVTLVKGSYKIVGASPDGDSVRFYPDDPAVWVRTGIAVKANAAGGVQLRLDAIDALETHYTPPQAAMPWRQQVGLGDGASQALLDLLGFTDVARDARGYVTSSTPLTRTGYILTRFADKYGRAVAMAYPGARRGRLPDGGSVHLGVAELRRSVNWHLLDAGWVYPTFYSRLYVDLRDDLAATAVAARSASRGVWAEDATLPGFSLRTRAQLTDDLVILPKLFRRLAEYLTLDDTGGVSLAGFLPFLAAYDDRLFTVPDGQFTSLDTLIERRGQTLRLTVPPEHIIFQEG